MADFQTQNIKRENVVSEEIAQFCSDRGNFKVLYLNIALLHDIENSLNANKIAVSDVLKPLTKEGKAKLMALPNNNLVLVFDKQLQDEVKSVLVKTKFLLSSSSKVRQAANLEECGVACFYDMASDFEEVKKKIAAACADVRVKLQTQNADKSFFGGYNRNFNKELTTELLAKVQKIISVADFSSFVRRQSVCAIIGKSAPQRVFEEVFVSIPDMRDSLLPDVDITANPWLFLALTETLDRRVLEIVSRHDDGSLAGNFSVNINVSTILSDDFLRFDDSINGSMRQSIILELQLVDIFSDIRSFILAKTFAKARGYKICIDGITVDKLKFLNRKNLDCDLMKIIWNPAIVDVLNEDKHFMDYMNKAERAKIVLCRIDDVAAVTAGNSLGINLYQGRYVQRLLNSMTKRG